MATKVMVIGRGATATVYRLNDHIVVKTAREGEEEEADHANEQRVFQILGSGPRIPYLIGCIHTVPNHTFLEYAPNGSLAELLNKHQKRNKATAYRQVIAVTQNIDPNNIRRWMWQLCQAAVGFEAAGMVHGDIRPGNILFSSEWNVRLGDLDRSISTNDDLEAVSEPFGRLLSRAEGEGAGTYGTAGARTEAFAIGSIYYTLLRGHEPYEMEDWGNEHYIILMEKFQNREFPPLDGSVGDTVIRKCWNAEYSSLVELSGEFMDAVHEDEILVEDLERSEILQEECKKIAQSGVLDTLER